MSNIVHDYIEDYIRGLLPGRDGQVKEMEEYAKKNNVPIVHPEVAQLLNVLIKSKGIKNILEVGTAIGYSSIIMAKSAGDGCHIDTIERNDDMYKIAVENVKSAGLENSINIIKNDAMEALKDIEGTYDMIFLDASKGHYDHFLELCLEHLKIGGFLISDNVLFRGMIATNELVIRRKITIVKRMRKYLKHITNMPELETVVIPISDGVALSLRVREEAQNEKN